MYMLHLIPFPHINITLHMAGLSEQPSVLVENAIAWGNGALSIQITAE